ncbi:MAG: PEP-CTERM sorting domain-containing protein [Candidatus Acidiferrum sp.]
MQTYAVDFTQYDEKDTSKWNYGSLRFKSDVPINVPEASTLLLSALGTIGLMFASRRLSWHIDCTTSNHGWK